MQIISRHIRHKTYNILTRKKTNSLAWRSIYWTMDWTPWSDRFPPENMGHDLWQNWSAPNWIPTVGSHDQSPAFEPMHLPAMTPQPQYHCHLISCAVMPMCVSIRKNDAGDLSVTPCVAQLCEHIVSAYSTSEPAGRAAIPPPNFDLTNTCTE